MLPQLYAARIVNCLLEGAIVAVLAWIALRLSGRQTSATRFATWFCVLVTISVLLCIGGPVSGASARFSHAHITLPGHWALYLFSAWLAVAAVGLFRIAAGVVRLIALHRRCREISPAGLDSMLQRPLHLRGKRKFVLCISDDVRAPTAIGLWKPTIVIPDWVLRELPAAELNAVVLHELAHLRRWDDWTNLAQKVLSALLFFHPAVWWIDSRLTLEREMACDDLVLAETANPRAYAGCLIALAERGLLRRGLALAQAAVGRMRHTSLRVLHILDGNRPRSTTPWKPASAIVTTLAVGSLVMFSRMPSLVAFEDVPAPIALTGSAPQSMHTEPVAASLALEDDIAESLVAKAHASGTAVAQRNQTRDTLIRAKAKSWEAQSNSLKVIRITSTMPHDFSGKGFLVVTQNEQYIVSDQGSCRITVIRLTVYHPENSRVSGQNPAKST
jgi:beta-lactamase regulating signal transducer with metallopeptidase domain